MMQPMPYSQEQLQKLNAAALEAVADELASGQVRKGQGRLHRVTDQGDQWCCLGQMSDYACRQGVPVPRELRPEYACRRDCSTEYFGVAHVYLPPMIAGYFGFPYPNPPLPRADGTWRKAADWNDDGPDGKGPEPDFTTIAAALRRLAQLAREAQS